METLKITLILLFFSVSILANELGDYEIEKFRQDVLAKHNQLRARHGVPNLTINPELNDLAELQAMKNHLSAKTRRPTYVGRPLGINKVTYIGTPYFSGQKFTQFLYQTGKNFNYKSGKLSGKSTTFTQLIWKNTTSIGIGVWKQSNKIEVVAYYYPVGNVLGSVIQNVKPVLSKKKSHSRFTTQSVPTAASGLNIWEMINNIKPTNSHTKEDKYYSSFTTPSAIPTYTQPNVDEELDFVQPDDQAINDDITTLQLLAQNYPQNGSDEINLIRSESQIIDQDDNQVFDT